MSLAPCQLGVSSTEFDVQCLGRTEVGAYVGELVCRGLGALPALPATTASSVRRRTLSATNSASRGLGTTFMTVRPSAPGFAISPPGDTAPFTLIQA